MSTYSYICNMEKDTCEIESVIPETVERVNQQTGKFQELQALSELYKLLGDHTRIRILDALSISELCVCNLSAILDMSQSAISHQLRVLRTGRIVKYRKEGKNVFYSLDDEHISNIIKQGMEHIRE